LNVAKRSYGLSKIQTFFKRALKDSSVYVYQVYTWINRWTVRWKRDPLYMR